LAPSSLHLVLDPADTSYQHIGRTEDGWHDIRLPIRITGAPSGITPVLQGADLTLNTSSGNIAAGSSTPWKNFGVHTVIDARPVLDLAFRVRDDEWRRLALQPFTVHGTAYVALYGNERRARIGEPGQPVDLDGVARCALYPSKRGLRLTPLLHCEWPQRLRPGEFVSTLRSPSLVLSGPDAPTPAHLVERTSETSLASTSVDLLAAALHLSPLYELSRYQLLDSDVHPEIGFRELLACVKVEFELPDVLLADGFFEFGMGTLRLGRGPAIATIEGALPKEAGARRGLDVLLISEHAPKASGTLDGFTERAAAAGPSRYQVFVYYPGVYYLVPGPDQVPSRGPANKPPVFIRHARGAVWPDMPLVSLEGLIANGKRIVVKPGDHVTVDLTDNAR